jgi:hypothetical protein
MKVHLHSESGGFLRRTIGFRPEVVEDREDHDTFAVTGGSFTPPQKVPEREWEEAVCRTRVERRA